MSPVTEPSRYPLVYIPNPVEYSPYYGWFETRERGETVVFHLRGPFHETWHRFTWRLMPGINEDVGHEMMIIWARNKEASFCPLCFGNVLLDQQGTIACA